VSPQVLLWLGTLQGMKYVKKGGPVVSMATNFGSPLKIETESCDEQESCVEHLHKMLGPFPLPFTLSETQPRSLIELRLNALSATIRNKADWHSKRLNPEIVAKWQHEASVQHIAPDEFKFVIDELGYYDKLRNGSIEVADVDGVWKAPALFSPNIHSNFTRLVARLSDVPDAEKDWHPGSNNTVLDLVHPSLYLFVSGKTRTISFDPENGRTCLPATLPEAQPWNSTEFTSTKYQWIPTPVTIDASGKATFASYINNLHPEHHRELYSTLAEMFSQVLPVFESVLRFLKSPRTPKIDLSEHQMYDESGEPEGEDDDLNDRYDEWYENRPLIPISIPDYVEPAAITPVTLRDCRLQVIVKIQEIHLTPDNPVYDGGVWHVEGMENEAIVASAIYYYECSNITECTLSFRQAVEEPGYEQNDNRGVEAVFGLVDGEPLVQSLGSVVTKVLYLHRIMELTLVGTRIGLAQCLSASSFLF